ncbi:4Fe-4S dicluster domain-containing protein [Streptomyces sp. AM 2-1-1]|uniref:4Fe-4S dicluster domain-containing protein n=1 Tax=Streptomyces sp. AM 2-1-1 TaxID=3028709 RepID=UPI0023BA1B4B|nr:4Fe-4S dicluster domain-containing protein [Streptomyces sp. AM 2-1-1]WEH38256.1 4Fe-4S dicluster domain-containing protein [Streptomyces sp. AM 2-1-1]
MTADETSAAPADTTTGPAGISAPSSATSAAPAGKENRSFLRRLLSGPEADPAADAGYQDAPDRVGFFTDTSVCIGCKACEVACKEWNAVPEDGLTLTGMSYDNTQGLGASTWRHVAFVEQPKPARTGPPEPDGRPLLPLSAPGEAAPAVQESTRWLMSSDVCKHCTHAACLDVCPTGSLFRTEFGTVVVQQDICNGCGYCVPACPYGVIEQRPEDGRAFKCTLCYDRLGAGQEPACAKACPTESIQFGPLDELRERAALRVEQLHATGVPEARLYGHEPDDGVGGDGAFFLLLDDPEVYGLPPAPVVTTRDLPAMWMHAGVAACTLLATAGAAHALPALLCRLPGLFGKGPR